MGGATSFDRPSITAAPDPTPLVNHSRRSIVRLSLTAGFERVVNQIKGLIRAMAYPYRYLCHWEKISTLARLDARIDLSLLQQYYP